MLEEWRSVVGYEGLYEVSNAGRIRRIGKDRLGRRRYIGRVMATPVVRCYPKCVLHKAGQYKNFQLHHLVAAAFIGPKPPGHVVNHKNGIKTDARAENLEYVTPSDNHKHALRTGLFVPVHGGDHWAARLTDAQVAEIVVRSKAGATNAALAREYGCSAGLVSRYRNGLGRAAACQ